MSSPRFDRRERLALLPLGDPEADRLLTSVAEEAWWVLVLVLRDGTPVPGDAGGGVALFAEVGSPVRSDAC